jgi:hypothetical protein
LYSDNELKGNTPPFYLQKKIPIEQVFLPFPRRHKKTKTTIPFGQFFLAIIRRPKRTKTTISIGQICLPIPRRQKQQFQFHLDKFVFQFFPQWYCNSKNMSMNQTT